ncbi:MAG: tRNA lysidine(34) synthetase TilS [Woeseiaceae bacterium]|nr:tRNA lysidine(34) synthetase TilS [Woeseiaceae bacterium]
MSFDRESLGQALRKLAQLAGQPERLVIAYSGGLDSEVLLHALAALRGSFGADLLALHVDHGLQDESHAWSAHCASRANDLGVEFRALQVAVDKTSGQGVEAAAREARYAAFRAELQHGDWLLSAHHKDDQAETLLLNLLRGSGPAGLAGIGEVQPFGPAWLVRPLLPFAREELRHYAAAHDLEWIDDPSNEDRSFDRNYLRHEVFPVLQARWPDASSRLRQSGVLAGEAALLLDQLADSDLNSLGARADRLSVTGLLALDEERQRNVLRYTVRELGLPPVPASALQSIVTDLLPARADAQPVVQWDGAEARRYRGRVYLLSQADESSPVRTLPVDAGHAELGPGLGLLRLEPGACRGLSTAVVQAGLEVRRRKGGEQIKPLGQAHTKKLKKLLQEEGVVPWMRERVPLVYSSDTLVAVADLWVADEAASSPGTAIRWEDRPALH